MVVDDLESQVQRVDQGLIALLLVHRAEVGDLLSLHVRHVELVGAARRNPQPQAFVAERQAYAVLGELDLASEQIVADFVRDHGFQVAIDEPLEATAIAAGSLRRLRENGNAREAQKHSAGDRRFHQ